MEYIRIGKYAIRPGLLAAQIAVFAVVAFLFASLGAMILWPAMALLAALFSAISGMPDSVRVIVACTLMTAVGVTLVMLKESKPIAYWLAEYAFAMMATGAAIKHIGSIYETPDPAAWYALAGAAYLTSRSIDNMLKMPMADEEDDGSSQRNPDVHSKGAQP